MLSSEEAEEGPVSQAAVSAGTALTATTASEPSEISLVLDQLRSLTERMERLEARNHLLPACSEQQERRRGQRRNEMRCNHCQQASHFARNCRAPVSTPAGNDNPQ